MIIFIFNVFLATIKLLAYSWFTSERLFLKMTLIGFLALILILLYKYPRPLENKLDIVVDYYKIHNTFEKILCFIILFLYIFLFIGGILYLRIYNKGKTLDLKLLCTKIYINLSDNIMVINFVNIILILLMLLLYIIILVKIIKFFKRYFVKMHIYYSGSIDNWYETYIREKFYHKYAYHKLINYVITKLHEYMDTDKHIFGFSLYFHFNILIIRFHYIILISIFLHDIIINNWILSNIYTVLPYIFIYDIYIRFCLLYGSLDVLYNADFTAHTYMYANNIQIINNKELWVDGYYYEIDYIVKVIFVYVKNGLNAEFLCIAIDGKEYCDNTLSPDSYYKKWKSMNKNKKI